MYEKGCGGGLLHSRNCAHQYLLRADPIIKTIWYQLDVQYSHQKFLFRVSVLDNS